MIVDFSLLAPSWCNCSINEQLRTLVCILCNFLIILFNNLTNRDSNWILWQHHSVLVWWQWHSRCLNQQTNETHFPSTWWRLNTRRSRPAWFKFLNKWKTRSRRLLLLCQLMMVRLGKAMHYFVHHLIDDGFLCSTRSVIADRAGRLVVWRQLLYDYSTSQQPYVTPLQATLRRWESV